MDSRRREDLPKRQRPLRHPRLHRRCPRAPPVLQHQEAVADDVAQLASADRQSGLGQAGWAGPSTEPRAGIVALRGVELYCRNGSEILSSHEDTCTSVTVGGGRAP